MKDSKSERIVFYALGSIVFIVPVICIALMLLDAINK